MRVYGIARDSVQQVELLFADAAYQNLKLVREVNGKWQLQIPFLANADDEKSATDVRRYSQQAPSNTRWKCQR